MAAKKGYGGLDRFKLAAAFLVVAIHTSPLASFSGEADLILTRVLARVAVPFFFMVTGYFGLPRYIFSHSMDKRPVFKMLNKHLILYFLAILLYLPVNLYAGQWENVSPGGFLRMFFFDGTFYHLWYLPAAVMGILLVWLLGKRLPFGALVGTTMLLYLVGLFGDSYYGLTAQVPFLKQVYDVLFSVSSYTRNGLFYAPLFMVMGAAAARETAGHFRKVGTAGAGFVICLVLMTAEGCLVHGLGLWRHDSMYLMLPPVMYFLFRLLLSVKAAPVERFRKISTGIYLIHPLCIVLVRGFAKAVPAAEPFVENSLLHYVAVCMASLVGTCTIVSFSERMAKRSSLAEGSGAKTAKRGGRSGKRYEKDRAWIALSRENLAWNVELLQGMMAPGQKLMPAVKAEAYGHGAKQIAGQLQEMGIDAFCVACVEEGISLRKNGITGDILILGYTHPRDFFFLLKYRLIQTVVDYEYAKQLNGYGKRIRVHVKIDTGMNRLGERAERHREILRIVALKNLQVEGLYTHLCADEKREGEDEIFTKEQAKRFYDVVNMLKEQGYSGFKVHLSASYGLLNYPELGGDFVRTGIALYGVLSERTSEMVGAGNQLRPVLSLKARIAAVKEVLPGEGVGYGQAYRSKEKGKIAVLAIGYGDGLPRALSCGVGRVLIHGKSAPVVGRICMDQTIVDINGIPDVRAGETAVLIGGSGAEEITVYELAEKTGTITNEILSRLGGRLARVWE